MNFSKTIYKVFLSITLALTLTACDTTESNNSPVSLTKGMTIVQIKEAMGEPVEIIQTDIAQGRGETWVFKKIIVTTDQIAADAVDVDYTNPITGETTTISEPIMELKSTTHNFRTLLYVLDGKLIGWKQSSKKSSSIGN